VDLAMIDERYVSESTDHDPRVQKYI
jgi:hypothetical protein